MENQRLERLRLEQEKKEKKKQKEVERKARLKAEGKLLTPKQKLDRARAQAMLDALRAQGAELPEVGEKRVRPGTRIRPNRKKDQQQANGGDEAKDEAAEAKDATADGERKDDKVEEPVEVIKDAWDESSSSEEEEEEEESQEKNGDDEEESESGEGSDSDDDSDDSEEEEQDRRNDVEDKRERALLRIQVKEAFVWFKESFSQFEFFFNFRNVVTMQSLSVPLTICVQLLYAFWATSIPAKQKSWTNYAEPTSKTAKLAASRNKLVLQMFPSKILRSNAA